VSGIFSFFDTYGFNLNKAIKTCKKMGHTIYHRVPDDYGLWYCQRLLYSPCLSITDISKFLYLPILLNSGRYIVCSNNDLYNNQDICYGINIHGKAIELEW
jgi:asparagine synthetase B (glutamine-hydrolysing)